MTGDMPREERAPERAARGGIAAFGVAVLGSVVFLVAYWSGGQTQLEGIGLALAFGGIGYGLTSWAHRMMPSGGAVEERDPMASPASERAAAEATVDHATSGIGRRRLLGGALATSLVTVGVAVLSPLRSMGLGERTGPRLERLRTTPWGERPTSPVVDIDNRSIAVTDLEPGEVVTVFPEGHAGSADAQALLIRLQADTPVQPPTRRDWMVEGHVCYSKICTHAGCPVGLYEAETHELFCPCHQSTFAVREGARPTQGPATRALPQLPLAVDDDGRLVATGDFPDVVGPGFWTRPRPGPDRDVEGEP